MLVVMTDDRQEPAGQYLPVAGTRFFADVRGRPEAPALLYLHGGPGMGSYEFMHWQGGLLARDLRLIGLDQRGVLRSAPVGEGDRLDEQVLADDCEAVREHLGLDRWAVLGHSFGGRTALRYASQHPDRVSAVIFENPTWDPWATDRYRLPVIADRFEAAGRATEARRCRDLAAGLEDPAGGYPAREIREAIMALDEPWFLADPAAKPRMDEADPDLPEEMFARSTTHHTRLLGDPGAITTLLPLLSRLTMPALLITGQADLVTSPDQAEAFRRQVPHGQTEEFKRSGHFAQFEQAEEYAEAVTRFVLAAAH
jgi:proline iminopeptidase